METQKLIKKEISDEFGVMTATDWVKIGDDMVPTTMIHVVEYPKGEDDVGLFPVTTRLSPNKIAQLKSDDLYIKDVLVNPRRGLAVALDRDKYPVFESALSGTSSILLRYEWALTSSTYQTDMQGGDFPGYIHSEASNGQGCYCDWMVDFPDDPSGLSDMRASHIGYFPGKLWE